MRSQWCYLQGQEDANGGCGGDLLLLLRLGTTTGVSGGLSGSGEAHIPSGRPL